MTTYQQVVFILGKSLESFEKSINTCNIHNMLDENVNVNKTFESLPPNVQRTEVQIKRIC